MNQPYENIDALERENFRLRKAILQIQVRCQDFREQPKSGMAVIAIICKQALDEKSIGNVT